ncbi:MAG: hypothetical protein Q9163_001998 [Psora crenata]
METSDQPMAEASRVDPAANGDVDVNAYYDIDNNRIRIVCFPTTHILRTEGIAHHALKLPGATDTAASFEFENEDHTLGNALRYTIMKNPEVELCGYSIPHPSEAKMNLRIQTYEGTTVYDALEKGFDDLTAICDVVIEKFVAARDEFNAEHQTQ